MTPAMQTQVNRILTYVQQLQMQVAADAQTIAQLTSQLTAAQAADQAPTLDATTVAQLLTTAGVP